eukprot:gene10442-biopygen22814
MARDTPPDRISATLRRQRQRRFHQPRGGGGGVTDTTRQFTSGHARTFHWNTLRGETAADARTVQLPLQLKLDTFFGGHPWLPSMVSFSNGAPSMRKPRDARAGPGGGTCNRGTVANCAAIAFLCQPDGPTAAPDEIQNAIFGGHPWVPCMVSFSNGDGRSWAPQNAPKSFKFQILPREYVPKG